MTGGFLYLCERCEDLTENKPDHRGRVRCASCNGDRDGFTVTVLGAGGVKTYPREETLTETNLRAFVATLDADATVLSISTPESVARDLEGPRADPFEFEREWLGRIGRQDLMPYEANFTADTQGAQHTPADVIEQMARESA